MNPAKPGFQTSEFVAVAWSFAVAILACVFSPNNQFALLLAAAAVGSYAHVAASYIQSRTVIKVNVIAKVGHSRSQDNEDEEPAPGEMGFMAGKLDRTAGD